MLGCGVVGIAIWLRISYQGYVSLLPQHKLLSLDSVVFMGGIITLVAAFLGCCGACSKNRCLLISVIINIVFFENKYFFPTNNYNFEFISILH